MTGNSWTSRLARHAVRPLIGTDITPNDITTARLVTGLMAAAALLPGTPVWTWWGGWLWLISTFLDNADGALARLGNMATPEGRIWDFQADNIVNPLFFVAIGIGARHTVLGNWAILLGLVAGISVFFGAYWSYALERRMGLTVKAYEGAFGFNLEDLLFLFAPLAWLDWLTPILVGAAIGAPVVMVLTGWRLRRLMTSTTRVEVVERRTA